MNMLQTIAQTSIEHLVNALPEGILIAAFAWALLRVLRRQNSGTRFAVWFLALLIVAGLPLLAALGEGHTLGSAGWLPSGVRPAVTIPASWALVVFVAWAAGASVAIMRLGAGLWRLRQLRQSCVPIATDDLAPALRKTFEAIRGYKSVTSRAITIASSESLRVPAAIGFLNRTIVLPAWTLRELPADDLNVILLHEFAHLQRGDDWTNLIQKIVRAIFFFHPAVWWIEKQLSMEREMACDDAVLAETSNPHGYASCLVSLLEKSLAHRLSQPRWSMVQAAVHRAREASLRLAQILDSNRPVATRVWKPAVGMISGFALVCLLTLVTAPQFVAFDRGMSGNFNAAYSTATDRPSLRSSLRGPVVIPAAVRSSEPSLAGSSPRATAKIIHAHLRPRQFAASGADVSAVNAVPPRLLEARVNVDQGIAPQVQTLVFIEATRYGSADGRLWSVQVWQVTFLSAVHHRVWMARVPVANSI